MPIPTSITRKQLNEALRPFYDLLGTNEFNVFPPLVFEFDSITFTVPAGHEQNPLGRVPSAACRLGADDLGPHPQGIEAEPVEVGHCCSAEFGYEVAVTIVDFTGDLDD